MVLQFKPKKRTARSNSTFDFPVKVEGRGYVSYAEYYALCCGKKD